MQEKNKGKIRLIYLYHHYSDLFKTNNVYYCCIDYSPGKQYEDSTKFRRLLWRIKHRNDCDRYFIYNHWIFWLREVWIRS